MNTIKMSATKARNNFFALLEQVKLGTQIIIEKDSKEIAIITPKKEKSNWSALLKATEETLGILKDDDLEDNPLRKLNNTNFLGNWDKDK